jgi:predicted MFS family arabinose efflux permease
MSTSNLVSLALGGIFADVIGLRNVFIVAGVLTVAAAIASALVFRAGANKPQAQPDAAEASSAAIEANERVAAAL